MPANKYIHQEKINKKLNECVTTPSFRVQEPVAACFRAISWLQQPKIFRNGNSRKAYVWQEIQI